MSRSGQIEIYEIFSLESIPGATEPNVVVRVTRVPIQVQREHAIIAAIVPVPAADERSNNPVARSCTLALACGRITIRGTRKNSARCSRAYFLCHRLDRCRRNSGTQKPTDQIANIFKSGRRRTILFCVNELQTMRCSKQNPQHIEIERCLFHGRNAIPFRDRFREILQYGNSSLLNALTQYKSLGLWKTQEYRIKPDIKFLCFSKCEKVLWRRHMIDIFSFYLSLRITPVIIPKRTPRSSATRHQQD